MHKFLQYLGYTFVNLMEHNLLNCLTCCGWVGQVNEGNCINATISNQKSMGITPKFDENQTSARCVTSCNKVVMQMQYDACSSIAFG